MKMDWDPVNHYKDVAVAERYDRERFSGLAGRVFNALERRTLRRAFSRTDRSSKVLDLPCGTGRLAETLLESGFHVIGVDISAPMLEVARRKLQRFGPKFETRVGDVRDLAHGERATYDVALCARVLMHFPLEGQIEFLKCVAVLTKGTVVFSQSLSTPYQRARRRIKQFMGNAPPAVYPITEADLKALLKGAGLREVRRYRLSAAISEAVFVVAEHMPDA
jgi:2-polyprenyl-3-methyl-5-hydroxy-6-metoxy-1,4-benzoquinol methylase